MVIAEYVTIGAFEALVLYQALGVMSLGQSMSHESSTTHTTTHRGIDDCLMIADQYIQ